MPIAKRKTEYILGLLLVILSVVAMVIKIFIGFDIDEGYAVSMPFRLLQGDRMFLDMWEVHQTSSFLPALFLWIYVKITGVTTGSVVYLRIVATVLHLVLSTMVYRCLKKRLGDSWSLLLALLYFNMLPKWLINLDFSMQQVWGMTLILILFARMLECGKQSYSFFMGVVLAATVLAYPGMVLSYPALLLSLWMTGKREEVKTKINKMILLTAGCALMAVLFFVYILSAMGLSEFLESIPMVFMDGTHQFTMETKLMTYAAQWMNVAKQLFIFSVPCVLITIVFEKVIKRHREHRHQEHSKITSGEQLGCVFLLSFITITSFLVIFANLFGIQMGPFHFQVRYLLFFLFVFCWSVLRPVREGRFLFWGPLLQMLIAFVAILIFSNVGPDSSSSYLSIGLIAAGVVLYHKTVDYGLGWNRAAWFVLSIFVLSLIFCKGYYVRITEYGPSNILQSREQIQVGPLKGIFVLKEDFDRVTEDYQTIQSATQENSSFLYLGTEGISNLYAQCEFVSPSTISTPAFNEQWVQYFERYPMKEPEVIVLAKNTIDNREKFFKENPLGIWIDTKYDVFRMEETDSLCIIRKK